MNSTSSVPGLVLLFSVALTPPVVPPVTMALPEAARSHPAAEIAHPAPESAPSPPAEPPGWFARALAAWGRPQPPREGLYDERYITW
jgi:hypothetical protein